MSESCEPRAVSSSVRDNDACFDVRGVGLIALCGRRGFGLGVRDVCDYPWSAK